MGRSRVEGMGDGKLAKRADAQKVKGRRGRTRLRWEVCVNSDLERVGEESRIRVKDGR